MYIIGEEDRLKNEKFNASDMVLGDIQYSYIRLKNQFQSYRINKNNVFIQ